jgi:hypothetical protein
MVRADPRMAPTRLVGTCAAILLSLAAGATGQDPGVPLTARAQALVDEITSLETRVEDWERRATVAETEAARMRKENDALRCGPSDARPRPAHVRARAAVLPASQLQRAPSSWLCCPFSLAGMRTAQDGSSAAGSDASDHAAASAAASAASAAAESFRRSGAAPLHPACPSSRWLPGSSAVERG